MQAQQVPTDGPAEVQSFLPSLLELGGLLENLCGGFKKTKTKKKPFTDSLTYTPAQSFKDDCCCSLTLKQMFLLLMGIQPDSQLKGAVVGGTVVTCTPSAGFLQMYFSLLLQLTTSHSPANTPVVMATHPCFLSFIKHTRVNIQYRTYRSEIFSWSFFFFKFHTNIRSKCHGTIKTFKHKAKKGVLYLACPRWSWWMWLFFLSSIWRGVCRLCWKGQSRNTFLVSCPHNWPRMRSHICN